MKKKIIHFLMLSFLATSILSSCGQNTNPEEEKVKEIYQLAKENGFTGTYEEWLLSIKGEPGKDGHSPKVTIGENGNWFIDGNDTGIKAKGEDGKPGQDGQQGEQGPEGKPGQDGEDGRSIVSIELTSSKDNVDTYTISYSDGTTSIFKVTNGKDGATGEQGIQGIQGEPGKDGHTPKITIGENGNWIIDGVDTNIKAQGPQGPIGPQGPQGEQGEQGPEGKPGQDGEDGRSIVSIELTSSKDNVDTYTISYSDGTTSTFKVTNGKDGATGEQGIQGIQGEPGKDGHTPKITIGENGNWIIDGVDTNIKAQGPQGPIGPQGPQGEQGPEGKPGQDGRSIVSIELTSSKDNVDTYTISYSDGTTSTFKVTNGKDGATGEQGIQGIQGEPGKDGHTPKITIGENGNWIIDGVDTNIKAQGPQGPIGPQGPQGEQGEQGPEGKPGQDGQDGDDFLQGETNPTDDLGKDGDTYLNTSTYDLYYKKDGKWIFKTNIKGSDAITYVPCTFYDYDGTKLYEDYVVKGSTLVYEGKIPTRITPDDKPGDPIYKFKGWDKPLSNIIEPTKFYAQYDVKEFVCSFYNYDDTFLYSTNVKYGEEAVYEGEAPTREGYFGYPCEFIGWNYDTKNITSDKYFVAQYYSDGLVGYLSISNKDEIESRTHNIINNTLELSIISDLNADVLDEAIRRKLIKIESSNNEIASVSGTTIKFVQPGEVTITVSTSLISDSVTLKISDYIPENIETKKIDEISNDIYGNAILTKAKIISKLENSYLIGDETGFTVATKPSNGGTFEVGDNVIIYGNSNEYRIRRNINVWYFRKISENIEIDDSFKEISFNEILNNTYEKNRSGFTATIECTVFDEYPSYPYDSYFNYYYLKMQGMDKDHAVIINDDNNLLQNSYGDSLLGKRFRLKGYFVDSLSYSYGKCYNFVPMEVLPLESLTINTISLTTKLNEISINQTISLEYNFGLEDGYVKPEVEVLSGKEYVKIDGYNVTGVQTGTTKVRLKYGAVTSNEVTINISNSDIIPSIDKVKKSAPYSFVKFKCKISHITYNRRHVQFEDDTGAIYLYNNKQPLPINLKVGDNVIIKGTFSIYSGYYQLENIVYCEKLDEEITTYQVEEFVSLEQLNENTVGRKFTCTGIVTQKLTNLVSAAYTFEIELSNKERVSIYVNSSRCDSEIFYLLQKMKVGDSVSFASYTNTNIEKLEVITFGEYGFYEIVEFKNNSNEVVEPLP